MQHHKDIHRSTEQGFTLVELMVVVAIIAILAAVAVPKLTTFLKNAHTASATENMGRISQYIEGKQSINGAFNAATDYYAIPPGATTSLDALKNVSKVLGIELETGHEWGYIIRIAYASEATRRSITGTCIMAVHRDGSGIANTNAAGKYILYSRAAVPNAVNWEGNFWKLSYLSDGAADGYIEVESGDCTALPTGTVTFP